jgi:hypothetical protein
MKNIAAAFVKAQKGFAPALKTNTNPHFRSKYVALDGCIEAVIDALNANGIALMQPTHQDETGVTVETLFIHESGETLSGGKLHVPAAKQDAQGYGSALTYARRYSLMAACGIAPEDDDGNAASKKPRGVVHSTKDAMKEEYDNLPEDRKQIVRGVVDAIMERYEHDDVIGAYGEYIGLDEQSTERFACWGFLPSNVRTALSKHKKSIEGAN